MENPVLVHQQILFQGKDQFALVEEGDVVGHLLQVAGDVGGDQHPVALILNKIQQQVQHLVPDDGVQAAGGFVQNQQLRSVGEGHGEGQLHLHPLGEILDFLILPQGEPGQEGVVSGPIPVAVHPGHHLAQLFGGEEVGKVVFVKHHPDPVFVLLLAGSLCLAEEGDVPAALLHLPQDAVDGGGFSGAILPDEAHDDAPGQGEGDVLQPKGAVVFGEMVDFQNVLVHLLVLLVHQGQ